VSRPLARNPSFAMREICALLALAILLTSLPAGAGVIITPSRVTSITMDICHPLPGFDRAPESILLARPDRGVLEVTIVEFAQVAEFVPAALDEFIATPDRPPPRRIDC
jgi:hypothetical protein